MGKQSVAEILREKLEALQRERAICSDPAQRFTLKKQIEGPRTSWPACPIHPRGVLMPAGPEST